MSEDKNQMTENAIRYAVQRSTFRVEKLQLFYINRILTTACSQSLFTEWVKMANPNYGV